MVGHDLAHDLACLGIASRVPARRLRDTARYAPFERHTRKPYKLRVLAKELLNVDIQSPNQAHDPREDALAAMRLYAGGESAVRAFFTSRRRDARDGARRFVRRRRRARRNEAAAFEKTEPSSVPVLVSGRVSGPDTAAARAARAESRAIDRGGGRRGFYKTEATREPKRALRDATNA